MRICTPDKAKEVMIYTEQDGLDVDVKMALGDDVITVLWFDKANRRIRLCDSLAEELDKMGFDANEDGEIVTG